MKKSLLFIIICGIVLIVSSLIAQAETITILDPLQGRTIPEIITGVTDLIVTIGIGVGMIMIIWSAILYMTAGGSEEKVRTAKKALMWTVIGIAILLSAKFIIQLIQKILEGS